MLKILVSGFVCFMMMGAVFAYDRSTEHVSMGFGQTSAESDATSYGTKAKYYA